MLNNSHKKNLLEGKITINKKDAQKKKNDIIQNQYLNIDIPLKTIWTDEEMNTLINLIKIHNYKDFQLIAKKIPGKTPEQCSEKLAELLLLKNVKDTWTIQGEDLLKKLVKKKGSKKRALCGKKIPGNSSKQCREHWISNLNFRFKKCYWSVEEDFLVLFLYKKYEGNWKKITLLFEGKSENNIKNRFFTQLRKAATQANHNFKKQCNSSSKTMIIFGTLFSIF